MADWFKFYENDLDETRLQYAIAKLPEVVAVWVGILSEACRHKVGTISWGEDSIEIFGFSRRLGISVPKVNEAVNLLCEIRYITKDKGTLNILKWNDKQSEYCQKKAKKEAATPDTVPTVSRQCRPRGEEKRREEREKSVTVNHRDSQINENRACLEANIPTWDEIRTVANARAIPEESARKFFDHHEGNRLWQNQYGKLINWQQKMQSWAASDRSRPESAKNGHQKPVGKMTKAEIIAQAIQ